MAHCSNAVLRLVECVAPLLEVLQRLRVPAQAKQPGHVVIVIGRPGKNWILRASAQAPYTHHDSTNPCIHARMRKHTHARAHTHMLDTCDTCSRVTAKEYTEQPF